MENEEEVKESYYKGIMNAPKISKKQYKIDTGDYLQQTSALPISNVNKKIRESTEEILAPSCETVKSNIKNKQYLCNFLLECSSDVEK